MTDLDRLLELLVKGTNIEQKYWTHEEKQEYRNLKSQLESKLAESPRTDGICVKCGRHKASWGNNRNTDIWCSLCITTVVRIKTEQEVKQLLRIQSQHTNLVKAIQEKLNKSQKIINERRNNKDTLIHIPFSETEIQEFQNLLESTKEKQD